MAANGGWRISGKRRRRGTAAAPWLLAGGSTSRGIGTASNAAVNVLHAFISDVKT